MKFRPVGADVLCGQTGRQAGRQAETTTLIVTFRNFANLTNKNYTSDCTRKWL